MTVLEPNALSALMQRQPDDQVVAWLDNHHAESIWISSITLFEARYELALLAPDQRKTEVLNKEGIPILGAELDAIVKGNVKASRLRLTTSVLDAVTDGTVPFIGGGTPPDQDGPADFRHVLNAGIAELRREPEKERRDDKP